MDMDTDTKRPVPDSADSRAADPKAVERDQAAWGYSSPYEPRWPATLTILAALVLYYTLPERLTPGPNWLVPALELVVIVPLNISAPRITPSRLRRQIALFLFGAISVANFIALVLLVQELIGRIAPVGHQQLDGPTLIVAAIHIWLTNVIIFGLWYWELDRGGPIERRKPRHAHPDFLFPQMSVPASAPHWTPGLVDYLYVSLTNSTAFSPTDTPPLTPAAKALMLAQSLVSLLTIALVAARAVNILK
jgi:uncharacterized membrane protein